MLFPFIFSINSEPLWAGKRQPWSQRMATLPWSLRRHLLGLFEIGSRQQKAHRTKAIWTPREVHAGISAAERSRSWIFDAGKEAACPRSKNHVGSSRLGGWKVTLLFSEPMDSDAHYGFQQEQSKEIKVLLYFKVIEVKHFAKNDVRIFEQRLKMR